MKFRQKFNKIWQYSFEALINIEFNFFPKSWLNKLLKPLPKVQSVILIQCNLEDKSILLNKLFPNINYLKLYSLYNNKNNQILTRFSHLTKVEIINLSDKQLPELKKLFYLNPQLLSCVYHNYSYFDWQIIKFIDSRMKDKCFQLRSHFPIEKNYVLKNVNKFVYCSYNETNFPFKFQKLQELECNDKIDLETIINQNKGLKKLILNIENFEVLNESLTQLSSITLKLINLSIFWENDLDILVKFINKKCTSNIKFEFINFSNKHINYIKSKLSTNEWNMK